MPFVGLTGGMGSGKSTALEALRRLGAEVLSSDAVVHELYEGEQLRDAVVARFGPEVAPGGVVDRAAVARRAFATAEDRAWLEGQVWPLVGARVAEWLEQARAMRPAPPAAVVEVPLLFEAGLDQLYDATIAVVSEESVRQRAGREAGTCLGGRARRAPALPGGEGAKSDVRGAQRRQRAGSRARAVGGSWQARRMSRRVFGAIAAIVVTVLFVGGGRLDVPARGDEPRAAAQRREHHPRTGRREEPRPGADRRGHLRGDEIRPAAILGRGAGPDADPAQHRLLPRAPVRRHQLHRQRSRRTERQRRLRQLLPALPARPLRRQRDARGGRVQRRSDERRRVGGAGRTRPAGSSRWREIPFPETREYVQRVLSAQAAYAPPTRGSSGSSRARGLL